MQSVMVRMLSFVVLFAFIYAAPSRVLAEEKKPEFLKYLDDGHGGGKLETAIATYKDKDGVVVHLVGAVHVGDKEYYEGLNKTFEGYDALLYEMVKPQDADAPKPGEVRSNSMVSVIQRFLKDALDLQFQLDQIDYTKPNFVHADLSAEEFQKLEEERGESIWGLMLQQMFREMMNPPADQPQMDLSDLLNALTSPDRARQLKLLLGKQFGHIEEQMAGFGGTVLIADRNKACFKVLRKQIDSGKKNIGIFYGAGHMPDMQDRLEEMGFHQTGIEWRVAWDVSAKSHRDGADEDHPVKKKSTKHQDDDDSGDRVIKP